MITENIISNSNYDGFWLDSSNNNTITKNHMLDNNNGIILNSTNNNLIYLNNFINNADNVYPTGSINIWNSTLKMTYTYNGNTYTNYLGNYWDDYKEKYPDAEEIDSTGIWDTAYRIDSDESDHRLHVGNDRTSG
jgi:parallel beta-helix repeat protein